jgi:hypothetical protein
VILRPLFNNLQHFEYWIASPIAWIVLAFQIWMLVDAIRRQEWMWAVFIFFFWVVSAVLYFFLVYRPSLPPGTGLFEWPGAAARRRIRELQAQIHHLDKPHHHSQLGDVYLSQGKFALAEQSYRAALEREPEELDTRAHLGTCLLRQNRPAEARPLLVAVCAQNPDHDYGETRMALAETLTALGEPAEAIEHWKGVNEAHGYIRARVQLAELYLSQKQTEPARALVEEVLHEYPHAPAFQRRRERSWMRRAKALSRKL